MVFDPQKRVRPPSGKRLLWSALATPSLLLGTVEPELEPWFRWLHSELASERETGIRSVAISRDPLGTTIRLGKPPQTARANPWIAAGASLLLPGTGQAYAGDWVRGSLFFGLALGLWGTAKLSPSWSASCATGIYGLSLLAPVDAFWLASPKE